MPRNLDCLSSARSAHGGRRAGAGRKPGCKNARTLELEARAREHAHDAFAALLAVAREGSSDAARVAAAVAILDRAYGRPRQAVAYVGAVNGPLQVRITHRIVDPVQRQSSAA
jgi:hypothetical protein